MRSPAPAAQALLHVQPMLSRCTILVVLLATASVVHAETASGDDSVALGTKESAIVGGSDVPPGKWPDTVAVLGAHGSCSGTLIAPDVVLTAGHCADIEPLTVVANTTDYSTSGGTRVAVDRTVAYPDWGTTYDVSVIVLKQPITTVTPRRLGTSCTFSQFTPNTNVHLVGFGATSTDGKAINTHLKEVMTLVIDPTCAAGRGCNEIVAPGGEFVAGGTGTADSCFGDSGGPVYLDTVRGPMVIGAVSRGVDNAATACGGGGIYVRTDKIIDWIEDTVGKTIEKDSCINPDGTDESNYAADAPETDEIGGGCSTGRGTGGGSLVGVGLAAIALAARRRRAVCV
jgi:secreted trypsin-like serine protease